MTFEEWGNSYYPGWNKTGIEGWKAELKVAWDASRSPSTEPAKDSCICDDCERNVNVRHCNYGWEPLENKCESFQGRRLTDSKPPKGEGND